jgi:hypothetical protein
MHGLLVTSPVAPSQQFRVTHARTQNALLPANSPFAAHVWQTQGIRGVQPPLHHDFLDGPTRLAGLGHSPLPLHIYHYENSSPNNKKLV